MQPKVQSVFQQMQISKIIEDTESVRLTKPGQITKVPVVPACHRIVKIVC